MTGFEGRQIADLLSSARAIGQHPGHIALQPVIEWLERILAWWSRRSRS